MGRKSEWPQSHRIPSFKSAGWPRLSGAGPISVPLGTEVACNQEHQGRGDRERRSVDEEGQGEGDGDEDASEWWANEGVHHHLRAPHPPIGLLQALLLDDGGEEGLGRVVPEDLGCSQEEGGETTKPRVPDPAERSVEPWVRVFLSRRGAWPFGRRTPLRIRRRCPGDGPASPARLPWSRSRQRSGCSPSGLLPRPGSH